MLEKIKNVFTDSLFTDYYDELIQVFISVSYKSNLAYATSAVIYIWFLFPFIPVFILVSWAITQFIYVLVRLYLAKIYKDVKLTHKDKIRFQDIHMILVLVGGLVWGIGSIVCVIYAPSPYEYLVLVLIIGLSAGSLSTLSPLYRVYLAYNLPSLILLIISFSIYGDSLHYAVAFMIAIFMLIVPSASWDIHKTLKRSIELKELYSQAQNELSEINMTLEKKVSTEVKRNLQKDRQMLEQSRLAQMGEMIAMIAHQWRQPLGAITAVTGSMTLHLHLEEYNEEYIFENIKKINMYTQHLSDTITDFRSFFKPDKEKSITNLNDIVLGSLAIIGSSLDANGIRLEKSFESEESILSFPNELKQVVLNILKNAQDVFIEKQTIKPRIQIKTASIDNSVQLTIHDNAGGICEEDIAHIFDPYFTTKEQLDGTGLGLYMSKMIVEDHCNGKLIVENIDNGACFSLTFPCK